MGDWDLEITLGLPSGTHRMLREKLSDLRRLLPDATLEDAARSTLAAALVRG